MAKSSAISEIIALGAKLEAAAALADNAASLSQAADEAQKRLDALRGEEARVHAEVDRAYADSSEMQKRTEAQARAIVSAAAAEAERTLETCRDQCARRIADADSACDQLAEEANEYRKKIAALEDEESRLAQSVTALKAELDALRARVLG